MAADTFANLPRSLPDPNAIRRVAEQVIRRPDYNIDAPPEDGLNLAELFLRALFRCLQAFFEFIKLIDGLPPVLYWLVIIGMCVVVVAIVGHIVWTIYSLFQRRQTSREFRLSTSQSSDPAVLERQAHEAGAAGDYVAAVRLLFRAALRRLEQAENRKFRRGATNRDYLRRYRGTPVFSALNVFVETIDHKWYGRELCVREDYEDCLAAHAEIRRSASDAVPQKPAAAVATQ
jgi:hypothetical protein